MEPSFGTRLKEIRESQGIDLATIALKTHIALVYLEAIEADDEEALPSQVQLRGFLRLYANELGVSLEDLSVSDYHLSVQDKAQTDFENDTADQSPSVESAEEPQPEVSSGSTLETLSDSEPDQHADLHAPETLAIDPFAEADQTRESSQIFSAIGDMLKSRRELLSLSLDKIHETIHIPIQHLQSIEAGRFDLLPSPVQAKGMLLNYAEFLNLESNALLLDYSKALQLQRIEKQTALPSRGRRAARELSPGRLRLKNFFTLDLLVITTLFIAFASFVIWGVNRILASDTPQTALNEIPGVSDVLLATETPTPMLLGEAEATPIIEEEESTDIIPEEEEPLFTPVVSTDPINILLIPRQRLWAQVTVDDEVVFQGRLLPGNAYDFSGQEQINILTGNIGSLQILFNNQEIPSQGLVGQVANLSFTDGGLVLPAPTSTATITPTADVTPTPTQLDDQTD